MFLSPYFPQIILIKIRKYCLSNKFEKLLLPYYCDDCFINSSECISILYLQKHSGVLANTCLATLLILKILLSIHSMQMW